MEAKKRKVHDGHGNIPSKLGRLAHPTFPNVATPSESASIHSHGVVTEGAELCNAVPPQNSNVNGEFDDILTLKDKAYAVLADKSLITKLIDRLFESNLLCHYIAQFQEIESGRLSPKNRAVLFGLERAYWQTLKSTTNMTYDAITKKWYAICQKLFGTSSLNMCSGEKNFGQVICKDTTKGNYCPSKSGINFAVPHRRHLVAVSKTFPKVIKPGIIEEGLCLVENQTDLVLMIDCKVARGLEDDFFGDVQLFGYEEPNVQMLRYSLEKDCDFCDHFSSDTENRTKEEMYDRIRRALHILCARIRCVRDKQQVQKTQLMRYEARVLRSSSSKEKQESQYPISKLKTYMYLSYLWIKKCMETIGYLCKISAKILRTKQLIHLNLNCFSFVDPQCRKLRI